MIDRDHSLMGEIGDERYCMEQSPSRAVGDDIKQPVAS
jgi:hypothetical protein